MLLLLFSASLAYGFVEAAYYLKAGLKPESSDVSGTWFNRAPVAVDLIALYRWTPGESRMMRMNHGSVVFDQIFAVNQQGFISRNDFQATRAPGKRRIIVFGDSFTAGHYLGVPWPERAQQLLGGNIQLDSFAVDGGGLANWHHLYFGIIAPEYEVDGIIFASFASDLARGITVYDTIDRSVMIGRYPTAFTSIEDYLANFRPKMGAIASIADDTEIERLISPPIDKARGWRAPPFEFYAAADIWRRIKLLYGAHDLDIDEWERFVSPDTLLTKEELAKRYSGRMTKMFEMLDHASARGIPVLLASIPSNTGAVDFAANDGRGVNEMQRELRSLAALYGADYFDGYGVFRDLSAREILEEHWLQGDGHWNQRGSDRFAEQLAEHIRGAWSRKIAGSAK